MSKDNAYTDTEKIKKIMDDRGSYRLRYVLEKHHGVSKNDISKVRLDGHNFKIDVWVGDDRMIRFKSKGTTNVLSSMPHEDGLMEMKLDPALNQTIYRIIDDYN